MFHQFSLFAINTCFFHLLAMYLLSLFFLLLYRGDCNIIGLFQYWYFGIGMRHYRDPGIPLVFRYVILGQARRPLLDNGLWKSIPEAETESVRLE